MLLGEKAHHETMNESQKQFGEPADTAKDKLRPYMTKWVQAFILQSPFCVVSTSNAQGQCDASPRGGLPGFVKVVDEGALLIPDFMGNKLFQSIENLESNPNVGLMFVIPGVDSMARVNGSVELIRMDNGVFKHLIETYFEINEQVKIRHLIKVTVKEAYSHCPRAIAHSKLWQLDTIKAHEQNPPIEKWKPGT